jgi:N-glycosylase/DNA lyase
LQNSLEFEGSFSLAKTFHCGQVFRFYFSEDRFILPYLNSILVFRENQSKINYSILGETVSETKIKRIIGLDHNINYINRYLLQRSPDLKRIIEFADGLRIMNLPPYETAISFIFSIQSSIPVIKKRLNAMSEYVGRYMEINGRRFYFFPGSSDLKSLSKVEISSLHLGFREKYFIEFIKNYDELFFENLRKLNYEDKRKELLKIKGIGEKVAQCILLFSLDELSAFPVDVWINRGMLNLYGKKGTGRSLTEQGRKLFGKYAGYAQEYMYYFLRFSS